MIENVKFISMNMKSIKDVDCQMLKAKIKLEYDFDVIPYIVTFKINIDDSDDVQTYITGEFTFSFTSNEEKISKQKVFNDLMEVVSPKFQKMMSCVLIEGNLLDETNTIIS